MNDVEVKNKFKSNLNRMMQKTGVKPVILSNLVGVNQSQVNRWMNGNLMPCWEHFVRLMDIFGKDAAAFLGTGVSRSSYEKRFKA